MYLVLGLISTFVGGALLVAAGIILINVSAILVRI